MVADRGVEDIAEGLDLLAADAGEDERAEVRLDPRVPCARVFVPLPELGAVLVQALAISDESLALRRIGSALLLCGDPFELLCIELALLVLALLTAAAYSARRSSVVYLSGMSTRSRE